ncbi:MULTISPECIES: hemerythrin domain-containing protein [Sphingomonas]|uniref:hemerythrin domain-containing protein n=1 Tax=Sphingomonas TaxID=13687 RepID=UPI000DEF4F61|nr:MULTISPECIES: hemerythrin domain-containing protein [Sphingomonas]
MDITDLILDQHQQQRRLFGLLQQMHDAKPDELSAVWGALKALLDVHAEAEERFFYPRLLKEGSGEADADSAKEETKDAIEDHNEIRDAGEAVDKEKPGSDSWFKAVTKADEANSKHMGEEERQGLADFREHASVDERHRLGIQFIAFTSEHREGIKAVDKDPDAYVKAPEKELAKG